MTLSIARRARGDAQDGGSGREAPSRETGTVTPEAPVPATTGLTPSGLGVQRLAQPGAGAAPVAPRSSPRRRLIVEDGTSDLEPGQMTKSAFLARLREQVESRVALELQGTIWSVTGCPWIDYWFNRYEGQDAAHCEEALHAYAPGTASARTAEECLPIAVERVARAVRRWAHPGEGGSETGSLPGAPGEPGGPGSLAFKDDGGARGAVTPAGVAGRLGAGQPLSGGARDRMERAFGEDFSGVRVHTDGPSARVASDLSATALTVGRDIVFARGEHAPGTLRGDALLAHELAHVVQQRGSGSFAGMEGPGSSFERQADRAAMGAVRALHGPEGTAAPAVRGLLPGAPGGLRIARCAQSQEPGELRDATVPLPGGVPMPEGTGEAPAVPALPAGDATTAAFAQSLIAAGRDGALGLLRARGARPMTQDIDAALVQIFGADAPTNHALWLARTIATRGSEEDWVAGTDPADPMRSVLSEYATRMTSGLTSEPFELGMPDVTDDERRQYAVQAYMFPGRRPDLRALVVGGVHGNEPQGAEVAERLRAQLAADCAAGNPPLFTTIIVPVLFRRAENYRPPVTDSSGQRLRRGERFIQGSWTRRSGRRDVAVTAVEPNRNFPGVGESYATARGRVARGEPELVSPTDPTRPASDTNVISTILPENRALITLIERFRPERLVTLHAHSVLPTDPVVSGRMTSEGRGRGDLPGVFVDPRGGYTESTDAPLTDEGRRDEALGRRLLDDARRRATTAVGTGSWPTSPFEGNDTTTWPSDLTGPAPYSPTTGSPTVHYASTRHQRGTSLGMWATSRGVTTVTVEVPQWSTSSERGSLDSIMNVYRDTLRDQFLNTE